MRHYRVLMLAGVIAIASSCSSGGYPTGGGGSCSGTMTNVAICDNFFSPNASTIAAGASITWTWKGANTHNVTFTSGPSILGGSPSQSSGTFNQTFVTPGTYNYKCSIHNFTGVITVN